MINKLSADIKTKGFLQYYFIFFVSLLIYFFVSFKGYGPDAPLYWLTLVIYIVAANVMSIAFNLHVISFIVYREKHFDFRGSFSKLLFKVILGGIISVVTIGIYYPWYIKKINNYYLSTVEYDGKNGELLSKPGRLLKYSILLVALPVIALIAVYAVIITAKLGSETYSLEPFTAIYLLLFLVCVIVLLLQLVFMYFYLTWILKIRYGSYTTDYVRKFGKTFLIFLGQSLLTVVTLFIYFPAAYIKIYRFISEGTEYYDSNGEKAGNFGFSGKTGKGFLLIWGQSLLSIITLGIYAPWAMVKVANWFVNNIYLEGIEKPLIDENKDQV